MKIIYTANIPEVRKQDACYRDSFLGVISGATSIEIDDDFPDADLVDRAYAFLGAQPLTATVSVGLTPELQAILDEAKAEYEKIQAENADLISDLKAALDAKDQFQAKLTETEGQLSAVQAENTELKAKVTEFEKAVVKKPTAAELKAAKAAEEAKAAEQQPQE